MLATEEMARTEHLVGRADELRSFGELLASLDAGSAAAVEVSGEAGIGKTRLLAELASRADKRGDLVLTGSASELEHDMPFWLFVDALDEYVQGLDPRELAALSTEARSELGTVLPSIGPVAPALAVATQDERYRSHRAIRSLVELIAVKQPLLLILDDIHWADAGSVELLGALLRRPPAGPVLLAMGVRSRQAPARLATALDGAHRSGFLTRQELDVLTRDEAEKLLGGTQSHAALEDFFQQSGGNPFYLEQLARSVRRRSRAATAPTSAMLTTADIPPLVASALTDELGRLSPDTRALLDGAAVAGDPFDLELAGSAAGAPETAVLDAIDELLRFDIVRQTDAPRRFRFRHPLIRRVVYVSTPAGFRLGAHERCAQVLAAAGAAAPARANHVERSARDGDMNAVATLREAGEAATQRSPGDAAHWFGSAIRLLPADAAPAVRADLLFARAEGLRATGRFAESHAALMESMQLLPQGDGPLGAKLTVACARLEQHLGHHREARTRLERALVDLDDPASQQAVELMIALAVNGLIAFNNDERRSWAARALTAAMPLEDHILRAEALALSAWPTGSDADAETRTKVDTAAALLDELPDDQVGRRLDALAYLATAEFYLDRFEAAARHAQRAVTVGRSIGQNDLFISVYWTLGNALWLQGRLTEAAEILDGAVEGARLLDNPQNLAWNLLNRSTVAFAAGDIAIALATAEEACELAQTLDRGVLSFFAALARAQPLLESGRAADAADPMLELGGGVELSAIPRHGNKARLLELLTRCLLSAGRRPDAERSASAAADCNPLDLPTASAMAQLAAAAVDLDSGDATAAAERAQHAAEAAKSVGDLFDAARAQLLAGMAFARAGDKGRAVDALEQAANAFESFESHRYRAEAVRELRKLGHRVHRRTRPGIRNADGIESLTERELEIARLVVDRRTNAEIAAQLFLSQKTIEAHLRNTFRKVDVANRVELARAVEHADHDTSDLATE
jgi:ATP/maltotriose-dependent transcriptional regulator MalT